MPPPLIPRTVLFGNPTRAAPRLSPDGTRLSWLAPVEGVLNVWVATSGGEDAHPVTDDRDRGVRSYLWTWDSQHILYIQDRGGDENWLLYRTDLATNNTVCLTPFDEVQVQLVEYHRRHPDTLVVAINRDDPAAHDAYRLDLPTGKLTLAARNPGNVVSWVPDADLQIRAAQAAGTDDGFDLLVRADESGEWKTLVHWGPEDTLTSSPLGFTRDGRALHLIDSRDWNAGRLVRIDIDSGKREVLAEDPVYDVGAVEIHPDTYEVQLVAFTRARREWVVLDPTIAADVDAIRAANPGDFSIVDRTARDDLWIVGYTNDTRPHAWYRYRRETRAAELLFVNRPELSDYVLAPMTPVSFPARDGLTLHGYLTRPVGVRGPGPLVLDVHGGPWHRDTWGYDAEAQWFANRGYSCLQVNFRGSTGYGKRFLNAGDREWGGRMHDDLIDALDWAIREHIADPDRVAIYGGSYGGYAALVGATKTPDRFCCAVDIVGVSNLLTFINSIPPYWSAYRKDLYRRVGNPEQDAAFLRERSPLTHVDNIRVPLLIAQGANDPRVKREESEQIVAAMKVKGIDYEYLLFPDEGHGFAKPDNNLKFYRSAEHFLAKHLGGRAEP